MNDTLIAIGPSTAIAPVAVAIVGPRIELASIFAERGRIYACLRKDREQRLVDASNTDIESPSERNRLWQESVEEGNRRERIRRRRMRGGSAA